MQKDQALKPKDLEILEGERIYEEILAFARTLPTPPAGLEESHTQFGNNFFMLFEALQIDRPHAEFDSTDVYLKNAEKYEDKWKNFLEQNKELVDKILEALKQVEQCDKLFILFVKLLNNKKVKNLWERIEEEENFEAFRVDAWNKLNPLLEQASRAMTACGIKAEDFYN